MRYGPNQDPQFSIAITYDCRGSRASKLFTDAHEARRFYAVKFKAGKNPELKAKKVEKR